MHVFNSVHAITSATQARMFSTVYRLLPQQHRHACFLQYTGYYLSDTGTHVLLTHDTLLGSPLEGSYAGVPDLIQVLHSLGHICQHVRASCVRAKTPDLLGQVLVPAKLVHQDFAPGLGLISGPNCALVNGLCQAILHGSHLEVQPARQAQHWVKTQLADCLSIEEYRLQVKAALCQHPTGRRSQLVSASSAAMQPAKQELSALHLLSAIAPSFYSTNVHFVDLIWSPSYFALDQKK